MQRFLYRFNSSHFGSLLGLLHLHPIPSFSLRSRRRLGRGSMQGRFWQSRSNSHRSQIFRLSDIGFTVGWNYVPASNPIAKFLSVDLAH
ncbi:hypothetical protein TNCT_468641 [Trichonephila clavata]|uniref:Uncharacterized protein n=1 Tax=Trichonephila clavata TaxID=2740835 RepID=A0A8X6LGS2_TRICU|nr:hypothetical protein TNCT_468641 [Trichonephila clavata]